MLPRGWNPGAGRALFPWRPQGKVQFPAFCNVQRPPALLGLRPLFLSSDQQRLMDPSHILSLWHSFLPLKRAPGLHGATRQPRITSFSWGELTSSPNPPLAQSHSTSAGSQGEDADILRGAVIILPTHGLYRTKRTLRAVSLRRDCGQAGTSDVTLCTRHGVIIKTSTVHVGFHHLDLMPIDVSAIRKQETEKTFSWRYMNAHRNTFTLQ